MSESRTLVGKVMRQGKRYPRGRVPEKGEAHLEVPSKRAQLPGRFQMARFVVTSSQMRA